MKRILGPVEPHTEFESPKPDSPPGFETIDRFESSPSTAHLEQISQKVLLFSKRSGPKTEPERQALLKEIKQIGKRGSHDEHAIQHLLALSQQLENMAIHTGSGPQVRFQQARYLIGGLLEVEKKKLSKASAENPELVSIANTHLEALSPKIGLQVLGLKSLDPTSHEQLVSSLLEQATQRSVYLIDVPRHLMMLACHPEKKIYRFYDPNTGIFLFRNPKDMAEFVAGYSATHYYPEFAEELAQNHLRTRFQLEVPIRQEGASALDLGVCAALSNHVAKWFLENPKREETSIRSSDLNLEEFDLDAQERKLLKQKNYPQYAQFQIQRLDDLISELTDRTQVIAIAQAVLENKIELAYQIIQNHPAAYLKPLINLIDIRSERPIQV